MSRGAGILNKVNAALRRVGPPDRTIYKRVVTETGGDALIGRPGTTTYTDTLLDPQPLYSRLGRFVVGDSLPAEILGSLNQNYVANDYLVVFSPTAVSRAELSSKTIVFLFRDSSNNDETFRVTDFEPVALNGVDVVFIGYLRSTARPA